MSSLRSCPSRRPSSFRLVSAHPLEGPEMATATKKRPQPKTEKTKVPGVFRRGEVYLYSYRVEGRQRWGRAATLDEARRAKRQAEADADPRRARRSHACALRRVRPRLGGALPGPHLTRLSRLDARCVPADAR